MSIFNKAGHAFNKVHASHMGTIHRGTHNVTGQLKRAAGTWNKPAGGIMGNRTPRDFAGIGASVLSVNPIFGIYERSRRGGMSRGEALKNAGSMGALYSQARGDQHAREKAADEEVQQAKADTDLKNKLTGVDASYGVGDGAGAAGNKQRLDEMFDNTANSWLSNGQADLQSNFASALRQNRYRMADTGLAGSGPDAEQQSGIVGTFTGARQGLFSGAANLKRNLSGVADQQRLNLKSMISGGGADDAEVAASARSANDELQSAANNVPAQTFGNLFTQAGQVYSSGQRAGASGNMGFAGLGIPSASNSSGGGRGQRIT